MQRRTSKRIFVICGFPFPVGYSGTNRIIAYCKGLIEYGYDVKVLVFRKTESFDKVTNTKKIGCYHGIEYRYPAKRIIKSKYKIMILFEYIIDLLKTILDLIKENKNKQIDTIIISTDNPFIVLLFSWASAYAKIKKIILIVDEYPKPIRYGGKKISVFAEYGFRLAFKRINGFISITEYILNYYKKITNNAFPYLIVPIIVENERFNHFKPKKENFITYIGNLEIEKDGLEILIKSYYRLNQININYRLILIGDGKDKEKLIALTKRLNICNKVIFKGDMSREMVEKYLSISKILCLSRQYSKRAEGGLPTKLGEYLSSGVPVVVTKVGEIPKYLRHKENAYLAEPDDCDDFSQQLLEVINNYEEAVEIGKRGRNLALKEFDYHHQSGRIVHFLNSL